MTMRVIYIIALNTYKWMVRYLILILPFWITVLFQYCWSHGRADKTGGCVHSYYYTMGTVHMVVGLTWQSLLMIMNNSYFTVLQIVDIYKTTSVPFICESYTLLQNIRTTLHIYIRLLKGQFMFRFHIMMIESTKTTSMEDVSTGVLEKNKEYLMMSAYPTRSKNVNECGHIDQCNNNVAIGEGCGITYSVNYSNGYLLDTVWLAHSVSSRDLLLHLSELIDAASNRWRDINVAYAYFEVFFHVGRSRILEVTSLHECMLYLVLCFIWLYWFFAMYFYLYLYRYPSRLLCLGTWHSRNCQLAGFQIRVIIMIPLCACIVYYIAIKYYIYIF